MQHTFFYTCLCRCFARLQRETSRKLLSYTFYGGDLLRVLVHGLKNLYLQNVFFFLFFFSLPPIFTLHRWPLAFLILSPPLENFHVVLPTKKMSPLLSISGSISPSPFFPLSFSSLPPNLSFSLSFSCSIFQICGHDN